METEKLIEEFLKQPIKIGDSVEVRGLGIQNKENFGNITKVIEVLEDDSIIILEYKQQRIIKKEDYLKNTRHIGYNPFPEKPWNSELKVVVFTLDSIIYSCGFEKAKSKWREETFDGVEVPELNWNPFFTNSNGEDVFYQRDFCWTLEQKKLLIDSIYNDLDIGKIIIRKRSFKFVKQRIKEGKLAAFKDVVDGKQRLNAIFEFIENKISDSNGIFYKDLSKNAQNTFGNFMGVSYGEIGETATDEDVKKMFVNLNFCGVRMSQEHLDYVKNLNL